jgi:hypothetical protein
MTHGIDKPLPFRGGVGVGAVKLAPVLSDKPHPLIPSPEGEGKP